MKKYLLPILFLLTACSSEKSWHLQWDRTPSTPTSQVHDFYIGQIPGDDTISVATYLRYDTFSFDSALTHTSRGDRTVPATKIILNDLFFRTPMQYDSLCKAEYKIIADTGGITTLNVKPKE